MLAEIIKENGNPKETMVGRKVTILRSAPNKRVWIRTDDGKELVWNLSYLKLLKRKEV